MKSKPVSKVVLYLLVLFIIANIVGTIYFLWPIFESSVLTTPTLPPAPTITETPTSTPTEIIPTEIPTESPSPTPEIPTLTPTEPSANFSGLQQQGVIILSLADGAYFHLFAYHPQYLPLLRLTDGEYDDIDPSISPDGTKIAFSSHRSGYWDLYTLDLLTGEISQLTSTPEYDGSPTWSPDSQWIAYESYTKGNLDIYLLEVAHPEKAPLELTNEPSTDFSPRWMPGETGRQIAFVSDRSGEDEIWIARLDNFNERFINISLDSESKDTHPSWSPDGRFLSWAKKTNGIETLVIWNNTNPNEPLKTVGTGDWPIWDPTGTTIASRVLQPNLTAFASYEIETGLIRIPLIRLPGPIQGMDWKIAGLPQALSSRLAEAPSPTAEPLWTPILAKDPVPAGMDGLAVLDGVSAPTPALLDSVDESFVGLRTRIGNLVGWDLLNSLKAAFTDKDTNEEPGMQNSWLSTGRGISINDLPMNSGWMALVREDMGTQTYWRIFLKTRTQDGSQGRPMTDKAWDITSRNSGDPSVYEKGGKEIGVPEGYWIDITEWAARYGRERFPALSNWITYYPGARFTLFAMTDGLDLNTALSQMYPGVNFSKPAVKNTLTPLPTAVPPEATSTPVKSK